MSVYEPMPRQMSLLNVYRSGKDRFCFNSRPKEVSRCRGSFGSSMLGFPEEPHVGARSAVCRWASQVRHTVFFIICVLVFPCILSCSFSQKAFWWAPSDPEANSLLASLKQVQGDFESFRGIGKLKIDGKGRSETMRIAWMGSRPANVRLEALGAWGLPVMRFFLKEKAFFVHDVQQSRYYKGRATSRNLSRFLSVPLEPEDLFSVLSGRPPLAAFHRVSLKGRKDDGSQCLWLFGKWNRLVQKLWLKDDGITVERVERFSPLGDLVYTIRFDGFKEMNGRVFPRNIDVIHASGLGLYLSVEKFRTGVTIPDEAYVIDLSHAEVVDLDS